MRDGIGVCALSAFVFLLAACVDPDDQPGADRNVLEVRDAPPLATVEGGALYLTRLGVETHRAEFLNAADCEHVASILSQAEPLVDWHCSTSEPEIVLDCTLSGFELGPEAEREGVALAPFLAFSLVLNRGAAWGESEIGVPLMFEYSESDDGYLLTSDYPFASGNYFTSAVYILAIEKATGAVEVRDIGGGSNGTGECASAAR